MAKIPLHKIMKLCLSILALVLFAACSGKPPADNAKAANIKAKNEELAVTNEVSAITRAAQKLENTGRGLEILRNSPKPEPQRECAALAETGQKEIADLDNRIQALPEKFKTSLAPIVSELNGCVACSKKASESCVKARSAINKVIKELYP